MPRPQSSRTRSRRFTPVELAIAFSLVASLLAVAVPTFVREVHASRFVEPVDGLKAIGAGAVLYAQGHSVAQAFPPSAPLTPATPPRGRCEADPPGTWEQPTWLALGFRPSAPGVPHCYSFSFDSTLSPTLSRFRAQARGDLDGDGLFSTFEIGGHDTAGDPGGPVLDPGMFIQSEVE
jgi:type IV pilus assembly protein PilA